MKILKVCVLILMSFATCHHYILAQPDEPQIPALKKFGLGLNIEQNLSNFVYYYQPFSSQLIFTWNIQDKIRIEPEVGFQSVNYHYDGNDNTRKENLINLGVGTYGLLVRNPVSLNYGINLGYTHYLENRKQNTTGKTTGKGIRIGPAIGLDYFISVHFSIGIDFKLLYLAELRKIDHDVSDQIIDEIRYKNWNSVGALKFRVYL